MRLTSLATAALIVTSSSNCLAAEDENLQLNETPQIATTFVNDAILPLIKPWHGASESLVVAADDPWATPFEQNGLKTSPSYDDTFVWLDKLIAQSEMLHKVSIGKSPQGREIWMIVASKEGAADAATLSNNDKPTLLVQAGIHSGEIDGKDAGMMLLRDIVFNGKAHLLDNANLLFVPIFSVDGHERASEFNRVNQRGPVNMGWRTTAQNLNLNRDYAKADTPEMQHMLRAINIWQPDLYIDVHVTDGIDYQYDVTFGYNLAQGKSPSIYKWLENSYRPAIEAALTKQGHVPGPLVFAMDNTDITKGMSLWNASPRFSNGYGDARHLPTILIENHSLKPYKQRVLGTYVMLEASLNSIADDNTKLTSAIQQDKYRYSPRLTLTWQQEQQAQGWDFKGIGYTLEQSAISGNEIVRWNGEPKLYENLPVIGGTKADISVSRPGAYYIPPQWQEVIERLSVHGIRMTTLTHAAEQTVQQYQFSDAKFAKADYEGRQRVNATVESQSVKLTLPAGTVRIDTKQPLGDLAMMLLEPQSPDSLFQWGFFNPIFTRTEYIENYAVEPLAQQMLTQNPALQTEFNQALKDEAFAADPKARLRWFYERSPYYDNQYLTYPVVRANQ
ncbi:M14 family metallopeptidase [Shewanella pneumatophori]|uniref:M14 family metallopeptidase n=1 Tax=Shewanella pneumatophori TaxID=314092 RepID=A0A9X1ZJB5_9GAMM|nr:M14 family metallopeptidase [Shewanella pneumatophori]MCL1140530.1 M14 family metallopeptidase [Shewanella pneumatophori]